VSDVTDLTDKPATKSEAEIAAPETKGETGDLIFDTLWSRVLEAWDDDKTHAALLDYALRNERLPDAAGHYRALKDDPEKGAVAKKKLEGIVVAATQMMLAMKSPAARMKVPWQIKLTAFAIMAFILAMIAYGLGHRH
jgi:hypothetical protein